MRLQSAIWVSAFVRTENADGAPAVVARRGAAEAGAIFVLQDHLDGAVTLYAPAPQSLVAEGNMSADRLFECVLERVSGETARDYLERQVRFDPDCWIVETERRTGRPALLD